ncbi:hypothetical protein SISSUDRAFT_1071593 [Sistotremastrum suecicum HHB10207 ss-3]|uniref:N-acetyl-D-glucosamine kinase n=1 Tax=Sistotremastrum suecicum HHB10207 ss-3 TaxID=1314776 RepID=A0A166BCT6_9AGAM|nr:hypothetical protein SISSUDRAFT_1071593 [Sistotremastrum suecicum HHB10207 ss-3]
MPLHLCIDCGGSKTSALFATSDGEILTRTLGGPSNFTYLGIHDFTAVIRTTVLKGLASLDIPFESKPFISAWIAVSGVDTASAVKSVSEAMSALLSIPLDGRNRLRVSNDTHLLASPLLAQSKYTTAMVGIAGTGSCVVSFAKEGNQVKELARTGGYGWILGDEGGGFDVGRETIRELCTRAESLFVAGEQLPEDAFQSSILAKFGLPPSSAPSDVFTQLYASDSIESQGHLALERPQRLSSLAPIVFNYAFPSDPCIPPHPTALKIVTTSASHLASQIALLCSPSPQINGKSKYIDASKSILCLGGSLVKQSPYRTLLREILKQKGCPFPEMVFVGDAEGEGINALVAAYKNQK